MKAIKGEKLRCAHFVNDHIFFNKVISKDGND